MSKWAGRLGIGKPARGVPPSPSCPALQPYNHLTINRLLTCQRQVFSLGQGGNAVARCNSATARNFPSSGEIAPEPAGHGLPLSKCEAYNRVYEQSYGSS